jgi:exopolysaccharide production protein ExoY
VSSIFAAPVIAGRLTDSSWLDWCERVFALLLLVLFSPVLAAVAMVIATLSGRTPLIAHRRVGQFGSELWVLKFRTMWDRRTATRGGIFAVERIDDEMGPRLKGPGDIRAASRFARFCRRHSLDELPQLIHVITGRMSLVGPRPVTRPEVDQIYGSDAFEVLSARPGMAGLWQVSGRNRLTLRQRRELDLKCVRSRSLRFYSTILLRAIPEVLGGKNTW